MRPSGYFITLIWHSEHFEFETSGLVEGPALLMRLKHIGFLTGKFFMKPILLIVLRFVQKVCTKQVS